MPGKPSGMDPLGGYHSIPAGTGDLTLLRVLGIR